MIRLVSLGSGSARLASNAAIHSKRCERFVGSLPLSNSRFSAVAQVRIPRTIKAQPSCCYFSTASAPPVKDETENNASNNTNSSTTTTKKTGLLSLLAPQERELLVEQKALMERARLLTTQVGKVSIKDYAGTFLDDIVDETTFSIVVAGEFNAGKSTLINALVGKKILESGALPTTDSITILTHQEEQEPLESVNEIDETIPSIENDGALDQPQGNSSGVVDSVTKHNVCSTSGGGVIVHQISNVPLLEDLTLVDTPGTNAVLADHTARTLRLLPTADLILFVTSADRPFPESERALLSSIQAYRKSIVIVTNKMDVLDTSGGSFGKEEKQRVVDFVTEHASDLLGGRPIVIPVSSRDALSAKLMGRHEDKTNNLPNNSVWERSNFAALESFLQDNLTTETKIKTKLTNPIGQAEGMVTASREALQLEKKDLELDVATIKLLHTQYAAWKKEMDAQMAEFRQDVASVLQSEGERAGILLSRVGLFQFYKTTLFDMKGLEMEYDNTRPNYSSKKSTEADLLEHVEETADSIATRGRAQGQAVIEFLGKRPAMKNQSLVGSVSAASRFEDTRRILVDNLSAAVKTHIATDDSSERNRVLGSLRQTAFLSSGLEVAALASGLATAAQVADAVVGMGACSFLALSGGLVFSQGRRNCRRGHQSTWKEREDRLDEALQSICSKELSRVERRILDGVAPYTRFVETEKERLETLEEASEDILAQAHALRNRINKLR